MVIGPNIKKKQTNVSFDAPYRANENEFAIFQRGKHFGLSYVHSKVKVTQCKLKFKNAKQITIITRS
jgi:hypothetical protein